MNLCCTTALGISAALRPGPDPRPFPAQAGKLPRAWPTAKCSAWGRLRTGREARRVLQIPNARKAHLHLFYLCLAIRGAYYNYFHELFSKVINSQLFLPKRLCLIVFKKYTATAERTEIPSSARMVSSISPAKSKHDEKVN